MAQVYSQNGWKAYPGTDTFVRFSAGGRGWWAANSDVATVLGHYVNWYDRVIERVVLPRETYDDWSHAFRPVREQTTGYSNHGSATAVDINATRHPRGVKGTFTPAQRELMRKKIASPELCDDAGRPVLRLGEFYSSTVDGMHVEVNVNAARIAQAARKIRALAEGDEMELTDRVKYTATARERLKKDDEVLSTVLQWPPATRIARDEVQVFRKEMLAQLAALNATVATLAGMIKSGDDLTAAQIEALITEASQAGAREALKELARELID
jgi:molybdopterin converting factor small subunit